jgi:hypothetical protein
MDGTIDASLMLGPSDKVISDAYVYVLYQCHWYV